MAAEWWFYHLERPPLAAALGPLFEKCLERDWRVLVSSHSQTALDQVDADLWKWRDDSFLPHGRTGDFSSEQPVLLSESTENLNKASVLVLLNGQDTSVSDIAFERVMVVFEDGDGQARGAARQQYARAKKNEHSVRYFQQTPSGGWAEKKS